MCVSCVVCVGIYFLQPGALAEGMSWNRYAWPVIFDAVTVTMTVIVAVTVTMAVIVTVTIIVTVTVT